MPPRWRHGHETVVACLVVSGLCASASAGESGRSLHWSNGAAFATENIWRGQSLTDGKPAIVGELKLVHGSGLYAGIWAGNLDLGPGTDKSVEVDHSLGQAVGQIQRQYRLSPPMLAFPESTDRRSGTWKRRAGALVDRLDRLPATAAHASSSLPGGNPCQRPRTLEDRRAATSVEWARDALPVASRRRRPVRHSRRAGWRSIATASRTAWNGNGPLPIPRHSFLSSLVFDRGRGRAVTVSAAAGGDPEGLQHRLGRGSLLTFVAQIPGVGVHALIGAVASLVNAVPVVARAPLASAFGYSPACCAMSRGGSLSDLFGRLHPTRNSPWIANLLLAAYAAVGGLLCRFHGRARALQRGVWISPAIGRNPLHAHT